MKKTVPEEKITETKWESRKKKYNNEISEVKNGKIRNDIKISIVIVAWKNTVLIKKNIDSLKNQTMQDYEIIFVCNGIKNGELDWLLEDISTLVYLKSNMGACFARNLGALFCTTPFIIFLDDDGIPDSNLIEAHFLAQNYFPKSFVIRGACLPMTRSTSSECNPSHYYYGWDIIPYYPNLEGNTSFKSEFFFKINGWNEDIRNGHEGLDLTIRAMKHGFTHINFMYIPTAILYHDFYKSPEEQNAKNERHKVGLRQLKEKYGNIESVNDIWKNHEFQFQNKIKIKKENNSAVIEYLKKFESVYNKNISNILDYKRDKIFIFDDNEVTRLSKLSKIEKIYIYGASTKGLWFKKICETFNIAITAFSDSDKNKHGSIIGGIKVISPDEISRKSVVIVCSQYSNEITSSLNKNRRDLRVYVPSP